MVWRDRSASADEGAFSFAMLGASRRKSTLDDIRFDTHIPSLQQLASQHSLETIHAPEMREHGVKATSDREHASALETVDGSDALGDLTVEFEEAGPEFSECALLRLHARSRVLNSCFRSRGSARWRNHGHAILGEGWDSDEGQNQRDAN
ncbi:MAG: hypothetical protein ACI9KE_001794 [Polyangiales bacterium]|jgi:hypothetical protein